MAYAYPTDLVRKLTGATSNQLKYWARIKLVAPEINGRRAHYSFKDIVKLRVLVSLRKNGLSLQKVRLGIKRLSEMLPDDEPLSRLIIFTDKTADIIVIAVKLYSCLGPDRPKNRLAGSVIINPDCADIRIKPECSADKTIGQNYVLGFFNPVN